MLGNRFTPTPPHAVDREEKGDADGKHVISTPPEAGGSNGHGASPTGAGGSGSDEAVRATDGPPQAKGAALAWRNAPPASEPVAKDFPESWRQDLAGGDKAFRKTLDRCESPAALAKAYRELTTRLSSGELRATKPLPDNATPEQTAVWRTDRGLPQNAAAYVDGLQRSGRAVAGEAEQALLSSFADEAMKGHWTAGQYNQAVHWYFDLQERMAAQRGHADSEFKRQASADLMREWNQDYEVNRNAISQFIDRSFPEDFKEALLTARLPNGQVLANHPAFNKAMLEVARTIDPGGTMLPNASGGRLSNVEGRIAEIEGKHLRATHGSDPWKSYWTGESGARMQQEYRGLLAAREQARRGRGA